MKITVEPTRRTTVLWYETEDKKKYVQFVLGNNFPTSVEIPDGAKLLTLEDAVDQD